MSRTKTKTGAKQFFYDNAGSSYPTGSSAEGIRRAKEEGAQRLAIAEYWAWDNGYEFHWEQDDITSEEHSDEAPFYPLWFCSMRRVADGKVFLCQSLSGIDFGRDAAPWGQAYKRVVEAELAIEQMPEWVRA